MTTRVIIVGGGPSGLSTAWHLTHGNPRAAELDVSLYTLGWRLGGKGATGRGPNGRIQEHGIHGFMGFYWNSTRMLDAAYDELIGAAKAGPAELGTASNTPVSNPLPETIEEALMPSEFSVDLAFHDRRFTETGTWLPSNDGVAWEGPALPTRADVVESLLDMVAISLRHRPVDAAGWQHGIAKRILRMVLGLSDSRVGRMVERLAKRVGRADHDAVVRDLDKLAGRLLDRALRGDHAAMSRFTRLDYVRTVIRGMDADGVFSDGKEIDDLDGEEYIAWLRRHGVHQATLETGLPHSPAFICFQYRDGDTTTAPSMSAAAYLGWIVRTAVSKGAPFSFFRAGTGDSVILPIYESTRRAGVRFEFFHKLEQVVPAADGSTIDRLVFRRQARLAPGSTRYDPLVRVDGVAGLVWPAEPRWDELDPDDGAAIQALDTDLESYWSAWPGVEEVVLERGRDFDHVVLTLPPSALPYTSRKLLDASPTLQRAVEALPTCATLGVQLWFDASLADLGWDTQLPRSQRYAGASFMNPLNGIVDFSDLIAMEGWRHGPDHPPRGLLYLCGPIQDLTDPLAHDFSDHRRPTIEYERCLTLTGQYLAAAATWLPNAANRRAGDTLGLDFGLLRAPEGTTGLNRLAHQYLKVNADPSERYVLSPPNSAAGRPQAWAAEAKNLTLAGDWIYTGINVGSFEGAATSGMLASHALTAHPPLKDILGYGLLHPGMEKVVVRPRIDEVLPPPVSIDLTTEAQHSLDVEA